jgi:hypothetical protein
MIDNRIRLHEKALPKVDMFLHIAGDSQPKVDIFSRISGRVSLPVFSAERGSLPLQNGSEK